MVTDQAVDHFEETDTPRPWHRQGAPEAKGTMRWETVRSYFLFRKYLELGDNRSYRKVAEQAGKSRTYIERLASRWQWKARAKAYFDFLDDEALKVFIGERQRMARRQAQTALLGQNIATRGLLQLEEELQQAGQLRKLKIHELARLFEVCSKIERICRGEPTEDQVASIVVHIERQDKPRYEEARLRDDLDGKPKFDA